MKKVQKKNKPKFYKLVEFPYPSGNLHMGHWYAFSVPDIFARYKTMKGYEVMYPIGFDAFGLPAENAAIKNKLQPADWTKKNIAVMTKQMKSMGTMFDWSRAVSTIDPGYYKWTQWIFLQFYKAGLAYRAKTLVNWCPSCKTVLANEQVIEGKCERCDSVVEQREREQWMYKITAFAEKLLEGLDRVDWSEVTKIAQRNWIGKSEGTEIMFRLTNTDLPPDPLPEEGGGMPGYVTTNAKEYHALYDKALEMRENPTQAEKILWERLRANKQEYHFRRQHIVDHFIVDFLCLRKNLIIEVDGDVHDAQQERDRERDDTLRGLGYTILRFRNEEVLQNIENVIKKINDTLSTFPLTPSEGRGDLPFGEVGGVSVFTTRLDTIFGATYLVLSPEHELISRLNLDSDQEIRTYCDQAKRKTALQRQESKEKTGVELKGIKAINPANGEKIPVWVADYVLGNYGTGAIMAVPAHDERDFAFAKKYHLPIKKVIMPPAVARMLRTASDIAVGAKTELRIESECFESEGELMNSGKFSGMNSEQAKWEITKTIGGKRTATYRLRDWILSRQRYWGTPIPLVFCEDCGWTPVPEEDLPVKLPKLENYLPVDDGSSPLARVEKWVKTKCPKCGGGAKRETDTMDTFVDSSWYFLRYTDPDNKKEFASKENMKKWLPVDLYTGGAEHNTMHLLYSRFFIKALHELGYVDFDEPFKVRRNHGTVLGPDGQKMSKSKGNVIDPDKEVAQYGADAVRMYLAFLGPYDTFNGPWEPKAIVGISRFLHRVWKLAHDAISNSQFPISKQIANPKLDQIINKAIKKVGEDIEMLHFNTAISELMKLLNEFENCKLKIENLEQFLLLLAPFAPHLTEELWSKDHKTSIHEESWPIYDPALILESTAHFAIQINGKTRAVIELPVNSSEQAVREKAEKDESVKRHLTAPIQKVIFVKEKLINFVLRHIR